MNKQITKNKNFLSNFNFNEKIVDFLKRNNIKNYNITSFGIILTACAPAICDRNNIKKCRFKPSFY